MQEEANRLENWRERMWLRIRTALPGTRRNTPVRNALPHNLNVTFDKIDGEQLLRLLQDVAVSSGAACSSAEPRPSHVLQAIGLTEQEAKSSIRIGLGRFNEESEIDYAVDYLIRTVRSLQ